MNNKKFAIARIKRKNSQLAGFVTTGFETTMNFDLATRDAYQENLIVHADKLNKCDKDYLYQVWCVDRI